MPKNFYNIVAVLFFCFTITANPVFGQAEIVNSTFPYWKVKGNINTDTSQHFVGTIDNVALTFRTNNIRRATINTNGKFGIGTVLPQQLLHLYGNNTIRIGGIATGGTFITTPAASTDKILYADANGDVRSIANGTSGQTLTASATGVPTWTTTSGLFWGTTGNASTNAATDFIGTTDAVDLVLRTNNTENVRVTSAGNVGVGVTAPYYKLEIANLATFGYGNGTDGSYKSRTETRDDAGADGAAGAQSGYYETSSPSNFPSGASSWWHLIDARHSNDANNYAMQISGSFFDQEMFFRKTNGSATTAWSRILSSSNLNSYAWETTGNSGTNAAANFIGTTDAVDWVVRTSNSERARVSSTGDLGIGTYPSYRLDVSGYGSSYVDLRTTGRIWINSPYGGVWLSDLQDCFMGNISSAQLGFWTSSVGWNAFNITKATGYVGIGTSGPTARLHVVSDGDNIPVIYGVNTNTSAGTTSFGVRGECGSSGLGSAGVSGVSTNSGQNEIGVLGDYSLWGASIFGLAWASAYTDMPTTRDFGVFGTVNYSTGTGVYGKNTITTSGAYGIYCNGNFAVTGTKAASVPTSKGNQLLYCVESPEIWFEEIGHGQLVNGSVTINLDPLFLETVVIDAAHPMEVFLQEKEETKGLIAKTGNTSFEVKEKANGNSNAKFSYRILAKRVNYQDHRFGVDANQPMEDNRAKYHYEQPGTTDPEVMKAFVENATREKESQYKQQHPKTKAPSSPVIEMKNPKPPAEGKR